MKKRAPRKARPVAKRKTTRRNPPPSARDPLFTPMAGADRHEVAGVKIDIARAGNGRIKRIVYPAGFRWSVHMKPTVGTELCMHAHVGLLARGRVHGEYADGCVFEYTAPGVVVVEPGHDAWVVGDEPAVLIQFDAEGETARRFGLPSEHRHARS